MSGPSGTSGSQRKKPLSNRRIAIAAAVFTLMGAIAGILALRPGETQAPTFSTGPVTGGDCAIVGTGNICTIEEQASDASKAANDADQLKKFLARGATASPQPPGPWPFMIYHTTTPSGVDIGLKVKSSPQQDGVQVGSVAARSLVWADCFVQNTYNPETGSDVDVGPKWLRIHWPSDTPGATYLNSTPSDRYEEYIYAGYALPFQQNGDIPKCS